MNILDCLTRVVLFFSGSVKLLQHIPLDGSPIITCSVADPHIVLLTEDGRIMLLMFKSDALGTGAKLTVFKPNDRQVCS